MDDLWYSLPTLTGDRIRLEPLAVEHAEGYLEAAATSADIFTWQSPPAGALAQPATVDDARRHIMSALAARAKGMRFPYAVTEVISGRFLGTTSFAEPDPRLRCLTIGYTWLGRPWWGSGVNTEAKLLMLTFAFETLGAVRVQLVTDIRNVRAQTAIERLGAVREGVMRKHRRRADGSWRDTVLYSIVDDDWPAVRKGLQRTAITADPA
ncbi:GNAT family protein [Actinoplanes sp. NPDC051851]|uniref:GNAT family N-acetyltransferase n=1 Tax=Actinoplanes sp. NPDC051851 TaxID=3154753 RepID=UPI003417EA76